MKTPFRVVPVIIDLTNFEDMYDLGLIAQQKKCDIRILIVDALIAYNLVQEGEHVPQISIPQIPVCDPDTLDVFWNSPGYLHLPIHFARRLAKWSLKRYGVPDGLQTALVREAISYFLEIVYYPDTDETFDQLENLDLEPNEFLLSEEAYIMLSALAGDKEVYAETLVELIMSSYFRIKKLSLAQNVSEEVVELDFCLVKVSDKYRMMLMAIAEDAKIPEEQALNIVVQYAWDLSEQGENRIIFTPK